MAILRRARWLPVATLWALGLGGLVWLWVRAADYYLLALTGDDARFDHVAHDTLRASGSFGHLIGIVGTGFILVNLAYLLRRHVPALRGVGSLRAWMMIHVFTGLAGFGIVLFHSAFHAGNVFHWVAAGALGLLVFTGVLGRFVYALVAHDREGREIQAGDQVVRLIGDGVEDEDALLEAVRRRERMRRLLHVWRDVHRPMAMVMATAATAHIVIALISTNEWLAEEPHLVHVWTFSAAGTVLLMFVGLELLLVRRRRRRVQRDLRTLVRSELSGLNIPVSLNPVVDLNKCMGSAACVAVCPETGILGLVNGQAHLVTGSRCIGHGRCAAECPTGAITLVFGSARRGVDIPYVSSDYETNVPRVYITGELGGMGLIQNAVRQSHLAVDHIAKHQPRGKGDVLDLVIVGAGPAGMAAALAAKKHGLRFAILDQEVAGGSIQHYPRHKVVMTAPFELPGYGHSKSRVMLKEELLELWQDALAANGIRIHEGEKVENVRPVGGAYEVVTATAVRKTVCAMLCIGRRGTPRKLGVPGEELPKVSYRLLDPDQYGGSRVLVVGGGDSAVENSLMLADSGVDVTLSYRQATVSRARAANREALEQAVAAGRVRFVPESEVTRIEEDSVTLHSRGETVRLDNDYVIVQAGGVLPLDLLNRAGVSFERKFGAA